MITSDISEVNQLIKKHKNIILVGLWLSIALLMPIKNASAATITDTINPTSWQAGSGVFLTTSQAGTTPPSETIAYRDGPGTVINVNLNTPEPVGGSNNELAIITFSTGLVCSDDTTVDISISTFSRELTHAVDGNDEYTISSGLIDLSGPTVTGYSQASRSTTGTYAAISPINYSTTAGNLSNVALFTNFEAATILGGTHYQGTAELGLPTITLEYDDTNCNHVPTVNDTSKTVASFATAKGRVIVKGSSLGAEDGNGDALSYSITSGNAKGYFSINSTNGNISATRSNIPVGTYVLTVLVDDGNSGTATATVTIRVIEADVLADTGSNQYSLAVISVVILGGSVALLKKRYL